MDLHQGPWSLLFSILHIFPSICFIVSDCFVVDQHEISFPDGFLPLLTMGLVTHRHNIYNQSPKTYIAQVSELVYCFCVCLVHLCIS